MNYLLVFLGGGLGSLLRYLTNLFCEKNISIFYPWATFFVNVAGSVFLGFCLGLFTHKFNNVDTSTKLFFTVGIAGGFTTFSTFCNESANFIKGDYSHIALLYIVLSVILGVLGIFAGHYLAKFV